MWLTYQVGLDYPLQTRREKVKKEQWKRQRETRKLFFLDHCSSCRFKSCVDAFKVIYLTPRCEFVIKIPRGDAELEEEEEEMAASQVYVLSRVWGCVCFSSWNAWSEHLQTFNSLLLIFLPRVFVANCLFFSSFSCVREDWLFRLFLPYVPEPVIQCMYPGFLHSMMNSQHCSVSFNVEHIPFFKDQHRETLV